jgi:peptidoglycan/LPS O-acetylase OafA/YrhL
VAGSQAMNYRREIDGLRALAVVPVILFHAGFQDFSGGFVGVDVFFVISGYLITSIILSEKQAGIFSLTAFYERRARRILPALFVVMVACWPFAWLWMQPIDMKDFSESLIAVSSFASNILFWQKIGYFDSAVELKPLLHTWSLAVEEQYYLLFPIFLLLTWRLGMQWVIGVLASVAFISLAAAQWGSLNKPAATFYLLPTRGWELLIGAFIAFYFFIKNDRATVQDKSSALISQSGSLAGFLLIAYAIFVFDKSIPFPGFYALIPTIGTALIILFANGQTLVGQLLGSKLFVGLGLISYSAYLWHQPLFAFARYNSSSEPSARLLLILSFFAIALAYITWKYVEKPFRDKRQVGRKAVLLFAITGSLSFAVIGFTGHLTDGYERYYYTYRLDEPQERIYSVIRKHTGGDMSLEMGDDGACNFWSENIDEKFNERFKRCSLRYDKAIVVLGDSHAMNIYNSLYKSGFDKFIVGISRGGCTPHNNLISCHYDGFDTFLFNNKHSVRYVIFHQSGSYLLKEYAFRVDSSKMFTNGKRYEVDYESIIKTSEYLSKLSELADVIWLGPFAEPRVDFKDLKSFVSNGFKMNKAVLKIFDNLDYELGKFLTEKKYPFKYLSLSEILAIDQNFLLLNDCLTYRDRNHLSACGEKIVGEKIKSRLAGHAALTH